MFGTHVWRRDPPCAWRRNKESLLNSPLTIESSILAFHSIASALLRSETPGEPTRLLASPVPLRRGASRVAPLERTAWGFVLLLVLFYRRLA